LAGSIIRSARADEAARLREIARAAYAKYASRIGREPAPLATDYVAAIAANHAVVIEHDGSVAGYLIGRPDADGFYVENIAVDPAYQGSGLGEALMRHVIAETKRLKLSSIWLFTNVAMTENRELYAHLGFIETHRALEHGYDRVYMRLLL
jgi:ribosomal protein S18 acetylase RimI-like enzyme